MSLTEFVHLFVAFDYTHIKILRSAFIISFSWIFLPKLKFFTTIATGSCGKFFRATRFFFRKKAKNYVLIEYFCTFCIISYNVSVNLSTYCQVCLLLQSKVCKTSLVGAFMHLCIYAFMHFCRELANDANYAFAQMRISFDKFHFCGNLKNKSRHHFAKKTSKISANCHCE